VSASSTCSAARPSRTSCSTRIPLFARLNLSDAEYRLYEKVYSHLKTADADARSRHLPAGAVDTLVERVHRRGVDFERKISASYLGRLADAYSRHFYGYDAAPLLIVNSERLNFVDNRDHVSLLLARIAAMRGPREFFNLAS
jgi:deoxyadenosine/deoxycytidine kinase